MAKKSKCCVPNCDKMELKTHRFPIFYENVYNIWLERIGYKKLYDVHPVNVNKNYVVCDKHFAEECKIPHSKKLKLYSLPTLCLPDSNAQYTTFAFPVTVAMDPSESNSSTLEECPEASTSAMEEPILVNDELSPPTKRPRNCQISDNIPVAMETSPITDIPVNDVLETPCVKRTRRVQNTGKKPRRNLLRDINIARKADMTPRKAYLHNAAAQLRDQNNKLSKRCLSYKQRIDAAEKYAESEFFKTLLESLDSVTYRFIMCQIRNKKFKPKGRRFTLDDKIMALALYKQSGKGYRLLSKLFALPSRKTMMSLLTKIPFNTGINKRIFFNLKNTVKKLRPRERNCVLVFDEMSIAANVQYNSYTDEIVGFEDLGAEHRKPEFADHVIVFMVRGISKKFKQPVAYYFTRSETNSTALIRLLKEVIRAVRDAGLKIISTVCDQAQTNVAAINYLKNETNASYLRRNEEFRGLGYEVDNEEIIHLYDSPHLLKGIRNNLLSKDVVFKMDGQIKTAKWSHIEELYDLDKNALDRDFKLCPKLTDYHVKINKIKKMKVSYAAQVMSQRVSAIMRRLAEYSVDSNKKILDPAAAETADFLLFVDKLFDSVNGSSVSPKTGKDLRCAITKNSKHEEFWNEALEVLESMRFVCPKTKKLITVPSINNWIQNLKCLKTIKEKLLNSGFKFINVRAFNQDPLENFFGQIRSHGVRHTNPTATSFKASFKALLLNNFVSTHSVGANCEEDETDGALNTLKSFVLDSSPEEDDDGQSRVIVSEEVTNEIHSGGPALHSELASETCMYVAGYIAKSILNKKNCNVCKNNVTGQQKPNSIITAREYRVGILHHPSDEFTKFVDDVKTIFDTYKDHYFERRDISKYIIKHIFKECPNIFNCETHDNMYEECVTFIVKFLLFSYLKMVNRILCGKITNVETTDVLKINANKFFAKKEKYKKKSQAAK